MLTLLEISHKEELFSFSRQRVSKIHLNRRQQLCLVGHSRPVTLLTRVSVSQRLFRWMQPKFDVKLRFVPFASEQPRQRCHFPSNFRSLGCTTGNLIDSYAYSLRALRFALANALNGIIRTPKFCVISVFLNDQQFFRTGSFPLRIEMFRRGINVSFDYQVKLITKLSTKWLEKTSSQLLTFWTLVRSTAFKFWFFLLIYEWSLRLVVFHLE